MSYPHHSRVASVEVGRSLDSLRGWASSSKYKGECNAGTAFLFISKPEYKSCIDACVDNHGRILDVTTAVLGDDLIGVLLLEQSRAFKTVMQVALGPHIPFPKYIRVSEKRYVALQEYLDMEVVPLVKVDVCSD